MKKEEREEIKALREKIIRLETFLEIEFKHLKEDLKEVFTSIKTLNDEYGKLIERQHTLEMKTKAEQDKYNRSLIYWKITAGIGSPILTTIIICLIRAIFKF